jgi:hypothetical protein
VRLSEEGEAPPVLVTLTRADATGKALELGVRVWIRPVANASQVRITSAAPASADSLDLSLTDSVPEPTFS